MNSVIPHSSQKVWDDMMDEICPVKAPERRKQMLELAERIRATGDYMGPNQCYVDSETETARQARLKRESVETEGQTST